jgi:predicted enzyme related to lactoylglutathione lyase
MQSLHMTIFYVADAAASAAFYEKLLGRPPIEASPTFAMFAFDNHVTFGLWGRAGVEPAVTASGGGSEIVFTVPDRDAVDATCRDWASRGIAIAQMPVQMDFSYTFTAADPDGHRIRVMQAAEM